MAWKCLTWPTFYKLAQLKIPMQLCRCFCELFIAGAVCKLGNIMLLTHCKMAPPLITPKHICNQNILFNGCRRHFASLVRGIRLLMTIVSGFDQVKGAGTERWSQETTHRPGVILWLVPRPQRRWCWRTWWSHQGRHLAQPTAVLSCECRLTSTVLFIIWCINFKKNISTTYIFRSVFRKSKLRLLWHQISWVIDWLSEWLNYPWASSAMEATTQTKFRTKVA